MHIYSDTLNQSLHFYGKANFQNSLLHISLDLYLISISELLFATKKKFILKKYLNS